MSRMARTISFGAAVALARPSIDCACDDKVIEACLRVRAEATASPWAYKPLLVRAMRGLVPDEVLPRTTKDHSGHEWFSGLKLQRPALAALAEDSLLVRHGLEAELSRPIYYELAEIAIAEGHKPLGVWSDGEFLQALLKPYRESGIYWHPVSTHILKTEKDMPYLAEPAQLIAA